MFGMKYYISHLLMVIDSRAEASRDDPVFMDCMQRAFVWANEMGLKGNTVHSLTIRGPVDALNQRHTCWCKMECTEEQYKRWEEQRKMNVDKALFDWFRDEETQDE